MAATLQTFSGGRFILGIGAGWKKDEYLAYGYEYPEKAADRLYQLEEAVQIIRKMWREPGPPSTGSITILKTPSASPSPSPCPPLMVGGGGKKITLRIAAQYADWWNFPGGSAENYQELLDVLRGHCLEVGGITTRLSRPGAPTAWPSPQTHAAAQVAESSPFYGGGQADRRLPG
jgi:alkanesulfonate monooxygenase SsuD/methylene tetrahydromethanopterin reductase-like flavin-dependent oxidoreductase (luciferase family)